MTMSDFILCLVVVALSVLSILHRAITSSRRRPWQLRSNDSSPEDAAYIKRDAWHHPEDI